MGNIASNNSNNESGASNGDFGGIVRDINQHIVRPAVNALNQLSNIIEHPPQQTEEEFFMEHMDQRYGSYTSSSTSAPPPQPSTENNENNENMENTEYREEIKIKKHILFNVDVERCNSCSICIEDFVPGETGMILCCGHAFHEECIEGWLNSNDTCPNCRTHNVMQKRKKEKFIDKHIVDLTLIEKLSSKSLKILLNEFYVDYTFCVEKSDLVSLVKNEIFYQDKETKFIKEYLVRHNIDISMYVDRTNLLNIVAFIRLTTRF